MEVKLNQKIKKGAVIIEGFPGFGLVGTIVTEYLIEHLTCEKIGNFFFEEIPATLAIHAGKIIDPISIHYNAKHNIVIVHSISAAQGIEWKAADAVLNVAQTLGSKEIISIEGVGGGGDDEAKSFYFSLDKKTQEKLGKLGVEPMKEGI